MCQFTITDELAWKNSLGGNEIIQSFTLESVERFLRSLGVEDIDVKDTYLVCPTICHNPLEQAESMKLYYYDETKNFHCYTECSENFSIISLYMRYMEINHQAITYDEALFYLRNFLTAPDEEFIYKKKEKHVVKKQKAPDFITLPELNKNLLDAFVEYPHPLWLKEGLSEEAQKHFNIRFSLLENKIIIPHYDIDGRLVGIRSRALEEKDLVFGKYRPVQVGDIMCNHPLGFNLYGLYEHKEAIQERQVAVIYEAEKSVIHDESIYGDLSVAVATCGSQLNKFQINLLVKKLKVNQIILAYDKEFDTPFSEEGKTYRKKLIEKCNKYSGYAEFYYIFDERGLLKKKDAPCDRGQEILEKLMKRKIKIE